MRKKRRLVRIKPDETSVHPVGQEQFISVQEYVGDSPSGESVDWLPQADEEEPWGFLLGTVDTEPSEED